MPRDGSPIPTQAPQPQHVGSTVSPSSCPAPGWRNQGVVMDQAGLPFALRLTDVEEMIELKVFDHQCFSSHPSSVALAVFGRAEMMLQLWSSSLSTGEVQWCAQLPVKVSFSCSLLNVHKDHCKRSDRIVWMIFYKVSRPFLIALRFWKSDVNHNFAQD